MKKELFGTLQNGTPIDAYTLTNASQMTVSLLTYGGIIASVSVPDRAGALCNVALGFNNLLAYETHNPFFGCVAGRYANRIAKGQFSLDGKTYQLATTDGPNHLHGGRKGFDKVVWAVTREISTDTAQGIELHYLSPAGEENYPGSLDVFMTYLLTEKNELRIEYRATSDAPTPVNLTNHSYWNLAGEGNGSACDLFLQLNADQYLPIDSTSIPLGPLAPVVGTPFDFRKPRRIADDLRSDHPQIIAGKGFDHNWVIRRGAADSAALVKAAELSHPASGRCLQVWTTEPGIQFYSGNFLDGANYGPSGRAYRQGDGIALETQHYPDSPNQPAYPNTILRPGQEFRSTTVFQFSVFA